MIDEAQEARNREWQRLKAESVPLMAEVDRLLSERHEPLTNVIPLPRKPPPEPPRTYYTDEVVNRMIGELREQLDEHCDYINGELASLLTRVFNDVADQFEGLRFDLQSLRSVQNKYVETDIDELKAEVASLRADHATLARTVESLSFEIASLRDDVQSIERSAGGKVVTLRGAS